MASGPDGTEAAFRGSYVEVDAETWGSLRYEVVHRAGLARQGAVGIVALTPADEVLLVRIFRYPVRDVLLEIPAGLLDVAGEDPAGCARRELLEETGHRADSIEFLAGTYPSPGLMDEYFQLFLAQASATPEAQHDADEIAEVVRMPFERALSSARGGRIRNGMTGLGLLLAAARLGRL